ncbi:MAG: NUDIX domain-containing protein [Chloroflexota bacterium]
MDSLKIYLDLLVKRPDLFRNTDEPGEIKIINDPDRIIREQRRIQAELRANGTPEHYLEIGILSEDEWCWVVRDLVEFPGGRVWGYIRTINRKSSEQGGFNVVLMCVQDENVLMIRKFRHEERSWSWEFPRGFGEPELSAEENALKELKEETGIVNAKLTCLTKTREGKGGTAIYFAEIEKGEIITIEKEEGISHYQWIARKKLDEFVRDGQLTDWYSL